MATLVLGIPIRADLTENDLQPLPLRKKEEHRDESDPGSWEEQSANLLLEISFLPSEIGDG